MSGGGGIITTHGGSVAVSELTSFGTNRKIMIRRKQWATASFDLNDAEQQRECFHYTNLQPLWATDNLSKGAKW